MKPIRKTIPDILAAVLLAAHWLWDKVAGGRSGANAASRVCARISSNAPYACQSSFNARILGGLLIMLSIMAITYSAALALVSGAASHTYARTNHATVLQQAAANYRLARAQCQRLDGSERNACIAEAHAGEDRARIAAAAQSRGDLAALRSQADVAVDGGDRDAIVIEPACNVVSRRQASVCEIQVNSNSANALGPVSDRMKWPRPAGGKNGQDRRTA